MPEEDNSCDPDLFIPFVEDGYVYACAIYTQGNGFVVKEKCGNEDCSVAKEGYGANVAPSKYTISCTGRNNTTFLSYTKIGISDKYRTCGQCKENQNGELVWLMVPATYSYSGGYLSDCTPWEK